MAKAKSSSTAKGVTIPAKQFAELRDIAKKLEQANTKAQATEARVNAAMERDRHPIKFLSNADIHAVSKRLNDVLFSLRAIHQLAFDGAFAEDDGIEWYLTAIKEMARANIKGMDACVEKLTGGIPMGIFATEFARD